MATELAAGPTADKVARPDPYFEGQADVVESFLFDKAKKKEPVLLFPMRRFPLGSPPSGSSHTRCAASVFLA